MNAEVRVHNGEPRLFLDGEAATGLMFFFGVVRGSDGDIRDFAKHGVDLFSGVFSLAASIQEDGAIDFTEIDERFEYVLAANPKVVLLPRIGLDHGRPPRWWMDTYRDEQQVDIRLDTGEEQRQRFSFSSRQWRDELGEALRACIRHCEERYGDHIMGYHLGAGNSGEWSYSWRRVLSDYSEVHQAAFRRWLTDRYGNDSALRTAWKDGAARIDTAGIPRDRLRAYDEFSILDPAEDRRIIDYLEFHSLALVDTLTYFAKTAKDTIRDLELEKLVGVFYGYHFKNLNKPFAFHNTGHFAHGPVLESEDIDFICAPYDYQGRESGNMYFAQLLAGSVRLHGKLYYCEDDTFTHLSVREPNRFRCPDQFSSIHVFRRNLAGVLRDGGTAWWMDCGGNQPDDNQIPGWYREPELMENFGRMERVAGERINAVDHTPIAQVAIFVSEESAKYQRQDSALYDALVVKQLFEIGAIGTSVDTYRVADIARLSRESWFDNYRMVMFVDALWVSAEERSAIKRHLLTSGRTVIWVYGAGIVTASGLDVESMRDLTNIGVALRRRNEPLLVGTFVAGERRYYGTERAIGPVIYGADPEADVLGYLINTVDPGLLSRRAEGWRSIFSAAPALPAWLLRRFAREAGVHLYTESGEQIIAERGYLSIHAAYDGSHRIRLPERSNVVDAYSGAAVAKGTREFEVDLRRGETATWRVTRTN